MTETEALAYCRHLARSHYENFHVASFFLPKSLRQPFHIVYAYCRCSDDIADEHDGSPESRHAALQRLDDWERQLDQCFDAVSGKAIGGSASRIFTPVPTPCDCGRAESHTGNCTTVSAELTEPTKTNNGEHPVFIALRWLIRQHALPKEPFADLLIAFRQDQTQQSYATFDDLLHYCRYSANPVGRIVLYLMGTPTAEQLAWSDSICTALQLTNFWQDVRRDRAVGRCYIPQDVATHFGVDLADLHDSPEFRRMIQELIVDARDRFQAGKPLIESVSPKLRADITLFIRGGLAILDAIEQIQFNVLEKRPALSRWTKLRLLAGTFWR